MLPRKASLLQLETSRSLRKESSILIPNMTEPSSSELPPYMERRKMNIDSSRTLQKTAYRLGMRKKFLQTESQF